MIIAKIIATLGMSVLLVLGYAYSTLSCHENGRCALIKFSFTLILIGIAIYGIWGSD